MKKEKKIENPFEKRVFLIYGNIHHLFSFLFIDVSKMKWQGGKKGKKKKRRILFFSSLQKKKDFGVYVIYGL